MPRATLVIAKLDRLARDVAFVSNLMKSDVEFIAADMPTVNKLTIHILAAVAEEKARMISTRTKAGLAAAKARGVQLGNPHFLARDPVLAARANEVQVANARRRAAAALPYVEQARKAGATTFAEIADALMVRGVPAPRGGRRWVPAQVRRAISSQTQKDEVLMTSGTKLAAMVSMGAALFADAAAQEVGQEGSTRQSAGAVVAAVMQRAWCALACC